MLDHPVSPMYSHELGEAICARIAQGEPLAQICREEGMPSDSTVRRWTNPKSPFHVEAFAAEYAVARSLGADAIADDCLRIADDRSHDWIEREGKDGRVERVFDAEHVQRSKLRIDTRLKLLAKWDPKRYGEKLETTHQAGNTLEALIMVGMEQDRAGIPIGYARADGGGSDSRTGLLLPLVTAVGGGLLGGSAAGAPESPMLARCLEEDDSAGVV